MENTFFKIHCNTCNKQTPHRDNTTTTVCELCYQPNFNSPRSFYDGWGLAAFWQNEYMSVAPRFTIVAPNIDNVMAQLSEPGIMGITGEFKLAAGGGYFTGK